ncbi:DNA-binding transcriptional LysR family regulator [Rhodopseudomonas julia]|uniref:DNA-binding transcriptional LysR family regulator n=1 Tax=Rhodopseudomonas julia TaxID=200617 RepID=A0ABU0C7M0_9BRAD|nr:LysR substrate-binding domain-containing protein [Rhodopseudomonas julia]MDQ0325959.1 DNA-binding transcriptional LysR family regulator [Rhodopseudomonas julia]
MDLASLAIFRTVARQESITRAAHLLGRVPSNVTTRIQQLEAEIGVPLFQRDRKSMTLTAEGVTYLDYADRILNLAEEAQQVVRPGEPAGTLRVGSMESTVAARLPLPLSEFNAQWPDVTVDLSTAPTRQLIDALLAHRIDCALVAVPPDEMWFAADAVATTRLFREELVLLLPPGHPEIQGPEEIRPRALAAFAPGCTYRLLAEEWLTGYGSRTARLQFQEVRSYHAMIALTAAGTCFSLLPRSVLDLVPDAGRFTLKPLMTVDTSLATRPGFRTPAFLKFRETLHAFSDIADVDDATQ